MPRTAGCRSHPLATGLLIVTLALGFWYAIHIGLISKPSSSPCGRHLKVSVLSITTRQVHIDRMQAKDGHIIAVQGTDTTTGESITMNTIWNDNYPDKPTTPRVQELTAGGTFVLTIKTYKRTDTASGCPGPQKYDYIVDVGSNPRSKTI